MESSIIEKLKVPELRKKLQELGLESCGLKAALINRLNEYYNCLRTKRLSRNYKDGEDEDGEDEDDEDEDDEDEDDEDEDDEDEDGEDEDDDIEEEVVEVVSNSTIRTATEIL